jgi:hypothetical protein
MSRSAWYGPRYSAISPTTPIQMDRGWKVCPRRAADRADWPFRWDPRLNRSIDRAACASDRSVVAPGRAAVAPDWPEWRIECATIAVERPAFALHRADVPILRPAGVVAWPAIAVCNAAKAVRGARKACSEPDIVDTELGITRTTACLSRKPVSIRIPGSGNRDSRGRMRRYPLKLSRSPAGMWPSLPH